MGNLQLNSHVVTPVSMRAYPTALYCACCVPSCAICVLMYTACLDFTDIFVSFSLPATTTTTAQQGNFKDLFKSIEDYENDLKIN